MLRTSNERYSELFRCNLVAGPSEAHVRDPIQLRYSDCRACEVDVAGSHAVNSAVGLDLHYISAICQGMHANGVRDSAPHREA